MLVGHACMPGLAHKSYPLLTSARWRTALLEPSLPSRKKVINTSSPRQVVSAKLRGHGFFQVQSLYARLWTIQLCDKTLQEDISSFISIWDPACICAVGLKTLFWSLLEMRSFGGDFLSGFRGAKDATLYLPRWSWSRQSVASFAPRCHDKKEGSIYFVERFWYCSMWHWLN